MLPTKRRRAPRAAIVMSARARDAIDNLLLSRSRAERDEISRRRAAWRQRRRQLNATGARTERVLTGSRSRVTAVSITRPSPHLLPHPLHGRLRRVWPSSVVHPNEHKRHLPEAPAFPPQNDFSRRISLSISCGVRACVRLVEHHQFHQSDERRSVAAVLVVLVPAAMPPPTH